MCPTGLCYLRNVLTRPISLPLASGGARLLGSSDTTKVDGPTRWSSPVSAAIGVGVLVVVVVAGPADCRQGSPHYGGPPRTVAARAPTSAPARHFRAIALGMEAMVEARRQLERAAGEAWIFDCPRWTEAEWRGDLAWRREAERAARRNEAVKRHNQKLEAMARSLRAAVERVGVDPWALVDGELDLRPALNGHATADLFLPPKPDESGPPSDRTRKLRAMRRTGNARRIVAAAIEASGERDVGRASAWLAERIAV